MRNADVNRDVGAALEIQHDVGVFDRLPRGLEEQSVLRVHVGRLTGRDAEKLGVELVDAIHEARGSAAAIIINPGAFTHYAWAIHDALAAFDGPIIEVHISNPNAREPWRHTSVVAPVATGSITGLGMHGYELAVQAVVRRLAAA